MPSQVSRRRNEGEKEERSVDLNRTCKRGIDRSAEQSITERTKTFECENKRYKARSEASEKGLTGQSTRMPGASVRFAVVGRLLR